MKGDPFIFVGGIGRCGQNHTVSEDELRRFFEKNCGQVPAHMHPLCTNLPSNFPHPCANISCPPLCPDTPPSFAPSPQAHWPYIQLPFHPSITNPFPSLHPYPDRDHHPNSQPTSPFHARPMPHLAPPTLPPTFLTSLRSSSGNGSAPQVGQD